ncbi:MAG: UvrD-helicase domain-containing protein, partial [Muribaculaceae bacterium]|nr:UvrD-helicase domain-containing protein [Muribaculaceae bacterium]
TFTNKATNEMKQRIVEKLADMARADGLSPVPQQMLDSVAYLKEFSETLDTDPANVGKAAKEALSVLLNDYSDFKVSTIDSFFQTVLRTFAYESNLNDTYQVEIDSDYLAAVAIDSTLDEINRDEALSPASRWIKTLMEENEEGRGWNIFQKNAANPNSIYSRLRNTVRKIDSEDFKEIRTSLDDYFLDSADNNRLATAYASIKKELETKLKSALSATRKAAIELRKALSDANVSPEETQRYLFNHIDKILTFKFNEGRKSKRLFKPLDLSKKSVFKKGKERPGTEHLTQLALTMYDRYDDWLKTLAAPEIILWECYAPLLPYLALLGEVRSKMNSFLETNNMIQLGETNSMLRQIIG